MLNPLRLPLPELLLRIGLAFSFLYPALHALSDPYAWIGYFPSALVTFVPVHEEVLLHIWGAVEVVLAVWVLFGKRILIPCVAMAIALTAVILANLSQFVILFRDVAIALMAIVLALLDRERHG